MQALFQVSPCGLQGDPMAPRSKVVREYFIAAELIQWNYAPLGMDTLTNDSLTESQRFGATLLATEISLFCGCSH